MCEITFFLAAILLLHAISTRAAHDGLLFLVQQEEADASAATALKLPSATPRGGDSNAAEDSFESILAQVQANSPALGVVVLRYAPP